MAIALAVVLLGVSVAVARGWFTGGVQQARLSDEALRMTQLSDAAQVYFAANPVATGAVKTIAVSDLVAAGNLKSSFPATTPLGQQYAASATVPAAGAKTEVVVYATGVAGITQLRKLGLGKLPASILAFYNRVAQQIATDPSRHSGTIPDNSSIATGAGNAWTKDLSASVLAGPLANATAVLLSGYPDIDPGSGGPGSNGSGNYVGCNVVHPTMTIAPPTCPSGLKQVASWPFCGKLNSYINPQYAVYPSDAGSVTVGTQDEVVSYNHLCFDGCPIAAILPPALIYWAYPNTVTGGTVQINSGTFTDSNCATTLSGGYSAASGGTCDVTQGASEIRAGSLCSVTTLNSIIDAQQTNAVDILCCASN